MRYAIVSEKAEPNYAAYVPDLPGCVTTGATIAEVEQDIREASELHIAGLNKDGEPVAVPSSELEYVEIAAGFERDSRLHHLRPPR